MYKEKLCLRPFQSEDLEQMLDILTDNTINRTYMLPDFACRTDAIPLFDRLSTLSHNSDRYVRCISADGKAIGFMNDVETKNGKIELGYVIHPDYQGKGYMTTALKIAIEELLETKFDTVICGAFLENAASIRVMEKSGMERIDFEEIIEYRGKAHNCIYYAINKEK